MTELERRSAAAQRPLHYTRSGYVPGKRLTDRSQLTEIIEIIFERGRTNPRTGRDIEPLLYQGHTTEELLALLPSGLPEYRSRKKDYVFNYAGVVAAQGITLGRVEDMIRAAMHGIKTELSEQQANGDWRLVAYAVEVRGIKRRARGRNEQMAQQEAAWRAGFEQVSGDGVIGTKPNATVLSLVDEEAVVIETAWVDVSGSPETDNWADRGETGRSAMDSLSRGVVPQFLKRHYSEARELLEQRQLLNPSDAVETVLMRLPSQADLLREMSEPERRRKLSGLTAEQVGGLCYELELPVAESKAANLRAILSALGDSEEEKVEVKAKPGKTKASE